MLLSVRWLILAILFAAVVATFMLWPRRSRQSVVTLGEHSLTVEVADTASKRAQGLSGREQLPEGRGMLFVFPVGGRHGIWMKDMRFAIDIVWLDENWNIVHIVRDAKPESFPAVFSSDSPAHYVLETNSGWVDTVQARIGDRMHIQYTVQ